MPWGDAPTQVGTQTAQTNGQTSASLNLGSTIAAGSLVVVACQSGGGLPTSVTDDHGNTYTRYGNSSRSPAFVALYAFYYAAAPGQTTVTVAFPSTNFSAHRAWSVPGAATSAHDIDGAGQNFSAAPSVDTSPTATGQADELVFVVLGAGGASSAASAPTPWGPDTGYTTLGTQLNSTRGYGSAYAYKYVSATGTQSASSGYSSSRTWAMALSTFKKAAGPQTVDLIPATEADAAQALAWEHPSTHVDLVPALETDTPAAIGRLYSVTAAVETDTAQALDYALLATHSLVPAVETDVAQTLVVEKPIHATLAAAAETDVAPVLSARKATALAPALEQDAAQAASAAKHVALASAAEADSAATLAYAKPIHVALTPAAELDAAAALSFAKPFGIDLVPAAETDAAASLSYAKPIHVDLAPATESDAAPPLGISRPGAHSLIPATTLDTALALDFAKPIHVGLVPAAELDTAQPLAASGPARVTLVPATESSSAVTLPVAKQLAIDAAQALGVALPLTPSKAAALAPAAEVDLALPASFTKTIYLGLVAALETDVARTLSVTSPGFVLHPRSGAVVAPRTAAPVPARLGGA